MSVKQVFNTSAELDYPTVLPTLDLDFANSKTLDPRITFTRASGGSYTGADGLIKYAGVNEARFDHDPVTGESLGLLIEESRSNLVLRSQEWATSPWGTISGVVGGFTVTNNVTTSPDGTSNASQMNSTSFTPGDSVYQDVLASGTGTYTLSVFVKGGTRNSITFAGFFTGNSAQSFSFGYNPLTNKIIAIGGGSNHTVVPYPNGWYRIYFTITGTNALNTTLRFQVYTNGTGITYLWGAQLEQGSFPTSYIPTVASTRTRAADNASITGKNFSEWYRQDEGTIFCDAKGIDNISGGNTRRYYEFNNQGDGSFRILSGYLNSVTTRFLIANNGLAQADLFQSNQSPFKNNIKTSSSFGINYFRFYSNGLFANDDNFGTLPTVDRVFIGGGGLSPELVLNGTISRLTYYPKALPPSQLQSLTS
jgi:hypothetical protein